MNQASRRAFFRNVAGTLPASWLAFQSRLAAAPAAGSEDYWLMVKRQFPLAENLLYLNAANVCPSSRPVLDRHLEFLRDFHRNPSFQNRDKYNDRKESLRSKLAAMLKVESDEIAITRNTSEASNIIVNGLDLKEGDEVLITSHNHPSSNDSWKVRAKRHKLVIKEAVTPVTAQSPQQLLDSVAAAITPRTRVMAITHVTSTTGNRYPVAEIAKLARQKGIWCHIDGAQTFGLFDINLRTMDCDSFSGSAHKWFMGPLEAGVLYVRSHRIPELWPSVITAGWSDSVKGARKYEVYGQRDDPRLAAFEAAVDFLDLVGMEQVEKRVNRLTSHLKLRLSENPAVQMKTPKDWAVSGGIVKVTVRGKSTRALYDTLYSGHQMAIAHTPAGESEGLRLSPHIYNSLEEMDQTADIIRQVS